MERLLIDPCILGWHSDYSIGDRINASGWDSNSYVTPNKAFYWPLILPGIYYFNRFGFMPSGAASGNVDLGLYKKDGTKLISTGSIANNLGASVLRLVSVPLTKLLPGEYFMAFACSSSAFFLRCNAGVSIAVYGVKEEASAFPLPSVATFTPCATTNVPIFGIYAPGFLE